MLLQRLLADDNIGFNYDYMGSAEYEYGATAHGRLKLAELFVSDKMVARRVQFIEQIGKNKSDPIEVLAIGAKDILDGLGDPMVIPVTKESFRTNQPNIIGWMHVAWHEEHLFPLLLVRGGLSEDEIKRRIGEFLKDPIAHVKEASAA